VSARDGNDAQAVCARDGAHGGERANIDASIRVCVWHAGRLHTLGCGVSWEASWSEDVSRVSRSCLLGHSGGQGDNDSLFERAWWRSRQRTTSCRFLGQEDGCHTQKVTAVDEVPQLSLVVASSRDKR
jgi:hypothetical protein